MSKPSKLLTIAAGVTFYNSFVLFEELVIDRFGWSKYMVCYKEAQFCEWDAGAIIIITAGLVFWYRRRCNKEDGNKNQK